MVATSRFGRHTFTFLLTALSMVILPGVTFGQSADLIWFGRGQIGPESAVSSVLNVTPKSAHSAVAKRLNAVAAGQRAILLTGFADDLLAADVLTLPSAQGAPGRRSAAALSIPSPWLDAGVARARKRVADWLTAYRGAKGPDPDLVLVRCRASMASDRYFPRLGRDGWSAVVTDPRFRSLAESIGIPSLNTSMLSSRSARLAWDRFFERQIDAYLEASITSQIRRSFPQSQVCLESRFCTSAGTSILEQRFGFKAPVQHVPVATNKRQSVGFDALAALAKDLSLQVRDSEIVVDLGAPGSVDWRNADGSSSFAQVHQDELLMHAAALGIRSVTGRGPSWGSDSGRALALSFTKARALIGAGTRSASRSAPNFDATRLVVSGSTCEGETKWRVSMSDGVTKAKAIFADGGLVFIERSDRSGGAWLTHAETRRLISVVAVEPEQILSASPTFTLISDDVRPAGRGSLQAKPYLIIYQAVDPDSFTTARINTERVLDAIAHELSAGARPEWGVLDFEHPFNEIMDEGATNPRFHAATTSLIETLAAVKSKFPDIRWTYYNFPRIPYWNSNRDWSSLPLAEREEIQGKAMSKYAGLISASDWFMPAMYDYYETALFDSRMAPLIVVAERSFKEATIEFLNRCMLQPGVGRKPILPAVSPWFMDGGRATECRPIPIAELVRDQFQPAIDGRVDGVAMWCSTRWLMTLATRDGTSFPDWVKREQLKVRRQFEIDLFGGTLPSDFDWTSPRDAGRVRERIDKVIDDANEALGRTVEASSAYGRPNGNS
jgi:hypothetical protein